MNRDDKKEKAEEIFFNNLFEQKEKEQDEHLYKNEFYVLEEEMKSNREQNPLQFMHDALLNKIMLEDYSPFPPKTEEPTNLNNQKDDKKKEDEQDKLIEEENEFLRSLHRINYLTFSPFGLSFFDENGKDNKNQSEEYLKEKEEKILHMIDFDYNNFEVTNDLLLNICQGFVDINKLKEENLTSNKVKSPVPNLNSKILPTDLDDNFLKEKEEEKDEEEKELIEIVNKKRKIEFYKEIIQKYESEYIDIKPSHKEERKEFVKKWKNTFKEKDVEYEQYLKKLKEEERKRKIEEKRLKEIETIKQKEREEQMEKQNELRQGLEEILKKAKKKGIISNSNSTGNIISKNTFKMEEKSSPRKSINHSKANNKNKVGLYSPYKKRQNKGSFYNKKAKK